jgi:tetratricopeptide (TPR) repeat protein
MRKSFLILLTIFFSFVMYAQTTGDAVRRMNNGQYDIAKTYWEALSDRHNNYSNYIAICNNCIILQKEALNLMATERYTKAIEKYKVILSKNPNDNNAKSQIKKCEELRAIYLAANELSTYTNNTYGYSLKYPAFMKREVPSTNEKVVFWSSDYNTQLTVKVTVENSQRANSVLFDNVISSYNGANVTYKTTKDNWMVISGYLSNGKTFYDKTFIVERKSQYNEPIKILVSACSICPKTDGRGSKLAEIIHKELKVNISGSTVMVQETDESRWQKARKSNTKQAYHNYLTYAPATSIYKEEAAARKAVFQAREDYDKELYTFAKRNFELGEKYLEYSDLEKYAISYYRYCRDYGTSVQELKEFIKRFPTRYSEIKVIKGRIVKVYCSLGLFSAAKDYVRSNSGIWYSEITPYTQKQWMQYIKHYNKKSNSKSKSTIKSVGNPTPKYGQQLYTSNVGYSFGVGGELSFPQLYEGAFPQVKISAAIGDNYNLFNLALDLSLGYSGDYGSTMKAVLAPRWNMLPDECFIYVQPEFGYDFLQNGIVYGARLGIGWEYLGNISVGYQMSEGFGRGLFQLSYVYNWYL